MPFRMKNQGPLIVVLAMLSLAGCSPRVGVFQIVHGDEVVETIEPAVTRSPVYSSSNLSIFGQSPGSKSYFVATEFDIGRRSRGLTNATGIINSQPFSAALVFPLSYSEAASKEALQLTNLGRFENLNHYPLTGAIFRPLTDALEFDGIEYSVVPAANSVANSPVLLIVLIKDRSLFDDFNSLLRTDAGLVGEIIIPIRFDDQPGAESYVTSGVNLRDLSVSSLRQ